MAWILLAVAAVLLGALAAALCIPNNRGKKEPRSTFTISYPVKIRICVGATAAAMAAVLLFTVLLAGDVVNQLAIFYLVYVVLIGLVLAMTAQLCCYSITIEGGTVTITSWRGKPKTFPASQISQLDVRKNDVRVLQADGTQLFTVGIMMENLDLFFAWTHTRPGIRLTMNGKDLPKEKR